MRNLYVLIVLAVLFYSCSNGEKDDEINDYDVALIDISNETDWEYLGVHKESGGYFTLNTLSTGESVMYVDTKNNEPIHTVHFDKNGYLEKLVIEDLIFVFSNFNEYKTDVTVFSPDGEFQKFREIETDYNWKNLKKNSDISGKNIDSKKSNFDNDDLHDFILGYKIGKCIASVVLTVGSAGAAWPTILWGCSGLLIDGLMAMLPNLELALADIGLVLELGAVADGCKELDPVLCVIALVEFSSLRMAEDNLKIKNNERIIKSLPSRVSTFMTQEILDDLTNLGMPIFYGNDPYNIDGYYFCNDLTNYSDSYSTFNDATFSFNEPLFNFFESSISVKYVDESNSESEENIGYIAGDDSFISVFVEQYITSYDSNNNEVNIQTASVYSGIKDQNGLNDFIFGFIVLNKENDVNNEYMKIGDYRIIYEADKFAEKVSSYPYSGKFINKGIESHQIFKIN